LTVQARDGSSWMPHGVAAGSRLLELGGEHLDGGPHRLVTADPGGQVDQRRELAQQRVRPGLVHQVGAAQQHH
jgi:hypothetical protein